MAPKRHAKQPSLLAVNHSDPQWSIGVDFIALSNLAGVLYRYGPAAEAVIASVNDSIADIAEDAGWKGKTAQAFRDAWDEDTQFADKLAAFEGGVADVIDGLALHLSYLQKELNDRIDQLNRTVALSNFGGNPAAAQMALREEQAKASRQVDAKVQEAQRKAAGELQELYMGKKGGWSAIKALDDLKHSKLVAADLKKTLSKVEDDLKDSVPGGGEKSLFGKITDSGMVKGAGTYGGIGTAIGGIVGPEGALVGGVIGGVGGAVWGALSS
ncbi:hypothetical protein [Actinomadura parmotrematis]|uniref:WXG100 family type VII secretion target n=1 Tax=Actinomadura parmotrematis TaxID=2864039 RepID=A0ABS7FUA0_9ACTN|nr:hypothetical protein [Actinomadura parmotrematis]MBW8483978.1 hypothetical protein [Actinomadura parmotrematis]